MNKNDFKNPLIQSGAILLLVFLLISIVAGSGSQGLWGSIGADGRAGANRVLKDTIGIELDGLRFSVNRRAGNRPVRRAATDE